MSINTCKECGKQFEASSPRVAYCSDIHYRPCPVCGKPVEAKYLSDPARRCEECKGKGKMTPKSRVNAAAVKTLGLNPVPTNNVAPIAGEVKSEGTYTLTYSGKDMLGFVNGHLYNIEVMWNGWSSYNVTASYDNTEDKTVDLMMPFSSLISVNQKFVVSC